MFGVYRTVLALLVVIGHLMDIPYVGSYAIVGFFILSGYLMTFIMQETYGYSAKGRWRYAANRALRLIPSYWVSLVLSVGVILWVGREVAADYRQYLGVPEDLSLWLQNLFLIYLDPRPSTVSPRIAPATWALTIEFTFYAVIALGASRKRQITWLWFAIGIAWLLGSFAFGLGGSWRYHFIGAGSLPFSIGALLYHYREALTQRIGNPPYAIGLGSVALVALFMIALAGRAIGSSIPTSLAFYGNYLVQAWLIFTLSKCSIPKFRGADKIIGDFSYHIYILHWTTGLFWAAAVFDLDTPDRSPKGLLVAGAATLSAIALSLLLTRFVDRPVEAVRQAIRNRDDKPRSTAL